MSLNSKMTALANSIRSKSSVTGTLSIDGMKSAVDSIEMGITPSGNISITDTNVTDATNYATAQVVDADLVAENIKKDVNILGIVGSFEGGSGLPSGITDIKTGTFTVAEAVSSYTVIHGGTTYPKAFLCILETPINRNLSENYSLAVYYYQGFSGTTTGATSINNTGYMYTSTTSAGNFSRGGNNGTYGSSSIDKVEMFVSSTTYFKPTVKNRITGEVEPAVYRWYAIW